MIEEQFKISGIITVIISIMTAIFFSVMISIPLQFYNIFQYVVSFIIFFSLTHLNFMYASYLYVKKLKNNMDTKNTQKKYENIF